MSWILKLYESSKKPITGQDVEEEIELKYLEIIRTVRDDDPDLFEKIKRQSPWLDLDMDTFVGTQGYYYRVLYNTLIWREFEDKIRQERDFASRRNQRLL